MTLATRSCFITQILNLLQGTSGFYENGDPLDDIYVVYGLGRGAKVSRLRSGPGFAARDIIPGRFHPRALLANGKNAFPPVKLISVTTNKMSQPKPAMSAFKRAPVTGGPPRQDVLAPLRAAQIVSSKPVLPAGTVRRTMSHNPVLTIARDPLDNPRLPSRARSTPLLPNFQAHARNGLRRLSMGTETTADGMLGRGRSKNES